MHGSDNQNAWWLFLTGDYDVLAPFWKDLQVYLVPLTMKGKGLHLRATNNYFPKTTWLGRINGWQSGHLASYRSQAPGSNSKDEDNQMVFEDWFVVACRSQNKLWWFFQDLSVRLCMFTLFFFSSTDVDLGGDWLTVLSVKTSPLIFVDFWNEIHVCGVRGCCLRLRFELQSHGGAMAFPRFVEYGIHLPWAPKTMKKGLAT